MVVASGCISPEENSPSATDASPGADVGNGSGQNNQSVAVETETPEAEPTTDEIATGLKLLKKIGPIDLSPYGEKTSGMAWTAQRETFSLDDSGSYIVTIGSNREPGIVFKAKDFPPKRIVILMVLRDATGNPVIESKMDEETGILYLTFRTYM